MRKLLLFMAIFAVTLTAFADSYPSTGNIAITEFVNEEVEGEILHEAVVSFDGMESENWVEFQVDIVGSSNVTILDVFTTGDGPFDIKKNRKIVFSTSVTDLVGQNGKLFRAYDEAATSTTIASGDAFLIVYEAAGDGTITLAGMTGKNANGNSYTFNDQTHVYNVASTQAPAHQHRYNTSKWQTDENTHWHACTSTKGTCDAPKSDEAAHVYGENAALSDYYMCSVCRYSSTTRKSEADQILADAVVEKINAIGTVEYTDACKALVDAARKAYDALNNTRKNLITAEQLKVLTDAEEAITPWSDLAAEIQKAKTLNASIFYSGGDHTTFVNTIIATMISYKGITGECTTELTTAAVDAKTALVAAEETFKASQVVDTKVDIDFGTQDNPATIQTEADKYYIDGAKGRMYLSAVALEPKGSKAFQLGYNDTDSLGVLRIGGDNATATVDFADYVAGSKDIVKFAFDFYHGNLTQKYAGFFINGADDAHIDGYMYQSYNQIMSSVEGENTFGWDEMGTKVTGVGSSSADNAKIAEASQNLTHYEVIYDFNRGVRYMTIDNVKKGQFTSTEFPLTSDQTPKQFVLTSDYNNSDRRCWFDNFKMTKIEAADYVAPTDEEYEAACELANLNITLNDAGYATFSCKVATTIATEGVKAYKAAVAGETITLTELTGNIPAGTGVLLYGETAGAQVEFAVATSGEAADVTGNNLKATSLADGTLAAYEANTYALGEGNEFLTYTGTEYIHNRAYIVHETANANMRIAFADGETTGIKDTVCKEASLDGKFLKEGSIVIIKNGTKHNVAGQMVK